MVLCFWNGFVLAIAKENETLKIRNSAFKEIINVRIGIITKEMYQSAINTYSKGRAPKTVASANAFFSSVLKANGYNLSEGVILPQKENKEIQIPSEAEVSAFLERALAF